MTDILKVKILLHDLGHEIVNNLFLIQDSNRNKFYLWRDGIFHPRIFNVDKFSYDCDRMTLISSNESAYFETLEEAISLCQAVGVEWSVSTVSGRPYTGIIPAGKTTKSAKLCNCTMITLIRTGCVCGGL